MNKKALAIEISKHPLIKKLLETKMATTSVVARLIVEEMTIDEAPRGEFYVGPKGTSGLRVRNNLKQIMDKAIQKSDPKSAIKKLEKFPEGFEVEGVSDEHMETLKKFAAFQISRGQKEIKTDPTAPEEQTPTEDNKEQQSPGNRIIDAITKSKDLTGWLEKFNYGVE